MKRGFITPLILFVSCMVMIMLIYLNYISTLESKIVIASRDKIQAQYLADTKINRFLYDEYYYSTHLLPKIEEYLKNPLKNNNPPAITLEEKDINPLDKKNAIDLDFITRDNQSFAVISTEAEYKGMNVFVQKSVPFVNSFFEKGSLPLISYDLDFDTCVKLDEFFEDIKDLDLDDLPSDFKKLRTFHDYKIEIQAITSSRRKMSIYSTNNTHTEEFVKETYPKVAFDIRNKLNRPISLEMLENTNTYTLALKGLMIVEGDLLVKGRFEFNGILILKGKDSKIIIESNENDYKPVFRGIIITEGTTDFLDKIDLIYDKYAIGQYGIYLPGFIDI